MGICAIWSSMDSMAVIKTVCCFAVSETKMLRTPEGGAPGTAHEGRGESRELNDMITEWKRVPQMRLISRVNEII